MEGGGRVPHCCWGSGGGGGGAGGCAGAKELCHCLGDGAGVEERCPPDDECVTFTEDQPP